MNIFSIFYPKCVKCKERITIKKDRVVYKYEMGWVGVRPVNYMHSLCYRKHFNLDDDCDVKGEYDLFKGFLRMGDK